MAAARPTVEVVEGRRAHEAFWRFPWALYRGDGNWVAPLRGDERRRWSEAYNPSLRGRRHRRFLARRAGRVVGRIAASTDPQFEALWEPHAGFFGFFECADDAEAARALLDAAGSTLRAWGHHTALGPVSLSLHDEAGVLVQGFDSPPMLLSPYNSHYIPALLEDAGCVPRLDFASYRWTPGRRLGPAVQRMLDAAGRNGADGAPAHVRPIDLSRFDDECRLLLDLYNDSFRTLWGVVPMTWDEFRARADSFRPFLRPEWILVLEVAGRPEGFCLLLPDIHAALRPLRGRLWPFGWLRLLCAVPRLDTGRLVLLGVRPSMRGRGHAVRLALAIDEAARRGGLREAELSVVQSNNLAIRHLIEGFGCPPVKTYRLYERHCDA